MCSTERSSLGAESAGELVSAGLASSPPSFHATGRCCLMISLGESPCDDCGELTKKRPPRDIVGGWGEKGERCANCCACGGASAGGGGARCGECCDWWE